MPFRLIGWSAAALAAASAQGASMGTLQCTQAFAGSKSNPHRIPPLVGGGVGAQGFEQAPSPGRPQDQDPSDLRAPDPAPPRLVALRSAALRRSELRSVSFGRR